MRTWWRVKAVKTVNPDDRRMMADRDYDALVAGT